jgi:hypothetical protein
MPRRVNADARVIVVEDERCRVDIVPFAAYSNVSGAEVAIRGIVRQRRFTTADRLADPGAILAMRSHYDPFFT